MNYTQVTVCSIVFLFGVASAGWWWLRSANNTNNFRNVNNNGNNNNNNANNNNGVALGSSPVRQSNPRYEAKSVQDGEKEIVTFLRERG